MSFYTSLTGLNSATAQLGVTSNNIANVGTAGFKRSRADFGDIFATSPLQKASSTVGQGVSLKQVSQEFSQGNVSFSSNALDLAITGDGFFPLQSADKLQNIYTRNGAFMLNEQFKVVNSAGQILMAATVDSTGSANVNERVELTIPQKTIGEANQTQQVQLGVNFPADAPVIKGVFNRDNSATYNKSTALTVYDKSGNGYLATIYYVKTQNASESSPFNKWQTHVYIGDDEVKASLVQATDSNKEQLYVNRYGQIQPKSVVSDDIDLTAKTMMFSLDQLTDKRTSVPASIKGTAPSSTYDLNSGVDFSTLTADELKDLFKVDIDGTGSPVSVDLSYLAGSTTKLTGTQLAVEATNYLNRTFGDERYFDFAASGSNGFMLTVGDDSQTFAMDLPSGSTKMTIDQVVAAMQAQVDTADSGSAISGITVGYDNATQSFSFTSSTTPAPVIKLSSGAATANSVLGFEVDDVEVGDTGAYPTAISPNSDTFVRPAALQRYGISMTYDTVNKVFQIASGTTGDGSTIAISESSTLGTNLFGMSDGEVVVSAAALRGVASRPAVAYGKTPGIPVNNNFTVDSSNNRFVVTVDDVRGVVTIPPRADYSLDSFITELEKGINLLADDQGGTVNGVKVAYDEAEGRFTFTTGTATSNSFIKVSGAAAWGLDATEAGRGETSTWIKPTQFTDPTTGKPMFIDESGDETDLANNFVSLPEWSPIFLDKGELTFDTGGNLVSPIAGSQLETVFLEDGKGALTINIDYSKSTQFTSPFAVLSQSQDGAPEGDLVGVTIGVDGLVSASYSNGTQKSLAKILLVNFSSPKGLRQIGDSSFLASSASGNPILGTAGGAGFGTIRAGATERSNVDLTQELVDLITAQRNFQANAKAIETSTTMTQAIINIRG